MRYTYPKPRRNVSQATVRRQELVLDLLGLAALLLIALLLYQQVAP